MATKKFLAKLGLDNNAQTITNVADPVNAQDAATRAYVLANAGSGGTAYVRTSTTASDGQTTFNAVYTGSLIEVFLNGVLLNAADYTASDGTTVVLASAALVNDLVETIAYGTTLVGITTASGGLNSLQYNHNGVMDGTTALTLDTDGLLVLESSGTATPIKPTAGVKLFGRSVANRMLPAFIGPSGIESSVQPFIARNKIGHFNPIGNSNTLPGISGIGLTTPIGTTTARTVAVGTALGRMKRLGYVSAATAGSLVHTRGGTAATGANQYTTGDITATPNYPLGGFHYVVRFGISDAVLVAGARMFIGMKSDINGPTNVEPLFAQSIGIAQLASDATQLHIVYGGTSAQTAIALGVTNFPISNSIPYELVLFAPASEQNIIYYQVTNLSRGVATSGNVSGTAVDVPTYNVLLSPHFWRTNNATAQAVGFDICSFYIETDQ